MTAERSAEPSTDTVPYVDIHETHTGIVILAGDRAYKVKKPVLTDFLDFRTHERRERACRREVELNSRLSPASYLGVAHLSDPAGGPVEPVIVMRRYRDHDRLASMVSGGRLGESILGVLDTIAGILARFHVCANRGRTIDEQGTVGAIERRWRENLSELRHYAGPGRFPNESIDRIEQMAVEFLAGRGALFANRIKERCIVDGPGDLLADDIFWVNGEPALLDCLDFDDQLRYIDRIDDAAFLAMDLEFLGRKDLGVYFFDRYLTHSADAAPQSLQDFYIAYRAAVRAKVDCVRLSQGKSDAAADAVRHLAIATQHLRDGAVRLALVGGGPGTGKSTLARALAEMVGARVISTDDVRRDLRESGVIGGEAGILDAGLYSPDNVAMVYEVALRRAGVCLANGYSVILDGTWRDPRMRRQARQLGARTHSAMLELVCCAAVSTAARRITARTRGSSDATPEIAAALAARDGDWDAAHRIDASGPLEDSVREAQQIWQRVV